MRAVLLGMALAWALSALLRRLRDRTRAFRPTGEMKGASYW